MAVAGGRIASWSSFPRWGSSCRPSAALPCARRVGTRRGDRLHEALILGLEPTLDEDVAYGLRLLVDIAQRSLADSPFQDPTTAVQALDRLHDILRQLARRPIPDGRSGRSRGGTAHRAHDVLGSLRAPCVRRDPSRRRRLPQVARRHEGRARRICERSRRRNAWGILDHELELLAAATERQIEDERDADAALHEDRERIGAATGPDQGS